jgi:hypothetical protein
VALLLAAFALRLGLACASIGSTDILLWEFFGTRIGEIGLLGNYGEIQLKGFVMNHPPVAAGFSVLVREISQASGLPIGPLFKLPMIVADVGIAALLGWLGAREGRPSLSLTCAYAFSPLAIGISAYHGNTDCLATALALGSAVLLMRKRPASSGLALAAALNVKLIPILLLPALALQIRDRPAARRFAAGFVCGLLPFVPFVAAQPLGFYQATLGYGSELNLWGPVALVYLASGASDLRSALGPWAKVYLDIGVPLLLALIGALCVCARWRPQLDLIELCGVCLAAFLVIAPGFGLQYLVYVLPFLLLADIRSGVAYSLLAGLFAIVIYASYWTGRFPPYSSFGDAGYPMPAPLIGLAAWALLVAWLAHAILRLLRPAAARA